MSATPSLMMRSTVYGQAAPPENDPAEDYHEASKLHAALVEHQGAGMARLAGTPALLEATRRPGRRNPQLPTIDLAPSPLPPITLAGAIGARRSTAPHATPPLPIDLLGAVVEAGYGVQEPGRRTVPSGGALYPLELYVVSLRVDGLAPGILRFDPGRHVLELTDGGDPRTGLLAASPLPELVADAAAVVFLTAVFWRTRTKYGLRGYRFALLEAGHAAQNLLLAATAARISALPLGGFYDAMVDDLLGVDGVDESVLYGVALGGCRC